MSGAGAPRTEKIDGGGLKVVIVAGTWHDVITDGLIAGAQRVLDEADAAYRLVRVPGSFELAVAAQAACRAAGYSPTVRNTAHVPAGISMTSRSSGASTSAVTATPCR